MNRVCEIQAEDLVSALGGAILIYIFPVFFVRIFLCLGPRSTGCEVERVRISRPSKGMNFLFATRERKRFAARGRNQIKLRRILFSFGIFGTGFVFIGRLPFGGKSNPAPIGRPLRRAVVSGLRELGERSGTIVGIR